MNFLELAKKRYSCKKYADRQITKEELDQILEAGRLAPTAKNLQEQHIYVIQSPEKLAIIDAATSLGVDNCWLNFFDPQALAKALELPENEELVMLLDLGYAAEGAGPLSNHDSRKPIEETVTYL